MSTVSPIPQDLVARLEALSPPTSGHCLGLVYSYFKEAGLVRVENKLRADGRHPLCLEPYPARSQQLSPRSMLRLLNRSADEADFELLALRWLKSLDQRLSSDRLAEQAGAIVLKGFDGRSYSLRRRNDFIAEFYREGTSEADESSSLATYAPFHKLVPAEPVEGRRIDCLSESDWGYGSLHKRLKRRLSGKRPQFSVMMWPFRTHIEYRDIEDPESKDDVRFVRLCQITNETEVTAEIEEALATACEKEVTILLFPELAVTETGERRVRDVLRSHGRDGFPILTLFGCCHRPSGDGKQYVNEAILLGPDGRELHRHRKLAAYTADRQLAERIEVGDVLSVLESCCGNLVPLICLDLPNVAVRRLLEQTHGSLFLVPSLSPKISAHASIARQLQASNRAGTFVCNRCFDRQPSPQEPKGTSFYRVPRRAHPYVAHVSHGAGPLPPYLLFELASR